MNKIGKKQRIYLDEKFGNRVNFRKLERKLYGHDIAAMPGLIKPIIGSTVPEVVVQPESEEELVELVRWAAKNSQANITPAPAYQQALGS